MDGWNGILYLSRKAAKKTTGGDWDGSELEVGLIISSIDGNMGAKMIEKRYVPFLKTVLTPKRLEHSLGVMQVMGELADVYGLDREKAQTIGVLHDAGKDLPSDVQGELIAEGNIQIHHESDRNYFLYLHGPVGAYLVKRELGISDELILGAITTHTYYGNTLNFNHPLSWCMRFSDFLEPNRDWRDINLVFKCVKRLRKLVYAGSMEEGAFLHASMLVQWFEDTNTPVHPNMRQVKAELGKKLGLDDSYLGMEKQKIL